MRMKHYIENLEKNNKIQIITYQDTAWQSPSHSSYSSSSPLPFTQSRVVSRLCPDVSDHDEPV